MRLSLGDSQKINGNNEETNLSKIIDAVIVIYYMKELTRVNINEEIQLIRLN
jgi:hypothetical protein